MGRPRKQYDNTPLGQWKQSLDEAVGPNRTNNDVAAATGVKNHIVTRIRGQGGSPCLDLALVEAVLREMLPSPQVDEMLSQYAEIVGVNRQEPSPILVPEPKAQPVVPRVRRPGQGQRLGLAAALAVAVVAGGALILDQARRSDPQAVPAPAKAASPSPAPAMDRSALSVSTSPTKSTAGPTKAAAATTRPVVAATPTVVPQAVSATPLSASPTKPSTAQKQPQPPKRPAGSAAGTAAELLPKPTPATTASALAPVGRVTGVHLGPVGTRQVRVSFTPASGARSYRVVFTVPTGDAQPVQAGQVLTLPHSVPGTYVTATVTPYGRDGGAGRPGNGGGNVG